MKKANSIPKLKELIIYIASKCSEDGNLTKTKLNKILYYCDFLYYKARQKSITDHDYVKLQYGPVPDGFQVILAEMMSNNEIATAISNSGLYSKEKIVALREAKLDLFDADMISHVDAVINTVCKEKSYTATQLSDLTHKKMGWITVPLTNRIPFHSIYVMDKKHQVAKDWEKSRAKEIAKTLAGQYGYPAAS